MADIGSEALTVPSSVETSAGGQAQPPGAEAEAVSQAEQLVKEAQQKGPSEALKRLAGQEPKKPSILTKAQQAFQEDWIRSHGIAGGPETAVNPDGGQGQPPKIEVGTVPQPEGRPTGGDVINDARQREVRQKYVDQNKFFRELASRDLAGLQTILSQEQGGLDGYIAAREQPNLTEEDKVILDQLIAESQGRVNAATEALQPKREETDKQKVDDEARQRGEQVEAVRRERAGLDELNSDVKKSEQALEGLRAEHEAAVASGDSAKLADVQDKIISENEKLNFSLEARKAAVDRAIKAGEINSVVESDQFRGMYAEADINKRANYLIDISRESASQNPEYLKILRDKARRGEKFSIREAALLYGDLSRRIVKGEKGAFKDLAGINARYPEIGIAILNAQAQNENLKRIKEKMPPGLFEKALQGDRNLLLVILMLLFATGAAAAKAVTSGMKI